MMLSLPYGNALFSKLNVKARCGRVRALCGRSERWQAPNPLSHLQIKIEKAFMLSRRDRHAEYRSPCPSFQRRQPQLKLRLPRVSVSTKPFKSNELDSQYLGFVHLKLWPANMGRECAMVHQSGCANLYLSNAVKSKPPGLGVRTSMPMQYSDAAEGTNVQSDWMTLRLQMSNRCRKPFPTSPEAHTQHASIEVHESSCHKLLLLFAVSCTQLTSHSWTLLEIPLCTRTGDLHQICLLRRC